MCVVVGPFRLCSQLPRTVWRNAYRQYVSCITTINLSTGYCVITFDQILHGVKKQYSRKRNCWTIEPQCYEHLCEKLTKGFWADSPRPWCQYHGVDKLVAQNVDSASSSLALLLSYCRDSEH